MDAHARTTTTNLRYRLGFSMANVSTLDVCTHGSEGTYGGFLIWYDANRDGDILVGRRTDDGEIWSAESTTGIRANDRNGIINARDITTNAADVDARGSDGGDGGRRRFNDANVAMSALVKGQSRDAIRIITWIIWYRTNGVTLTCLNNDGTSWNGPPISSMGRSSDGAASIWRANAAR